MTEEVVINEISRKFENKYKIGEGRLPRFVKQSTKQQWTESKEVAEL